MAELFILRVWLTDCRRCANEGASEEESPEGARLDLLAQGWSHDGYCPACNGVKR